MEAIQTIPRLPEACVRREDVARAGGVREATAVVENPTTETVRVTEALSLRLELPGENLRLTFFQSKWSKEFLPVTVLAAPITLEGAAGRCSADLHPQFFLTDGQGRCVLAVAIAWSGNWRFRLERVPSGVVVWAGMACVGMAHPVAPGEQYRAPSVLYMLPPGGTLDEVIRAFTALHRTERGPRADAALGMPVEWNHWWAYEDYGINEEVFLQNARVAAELGFECATLDAGWYGRPGERWDLIRGDWSQVNRERFPHGLRWLSDQVHALGLRFGLWCEIEALGARSETASQHPDWMATREGKPLLYLCLGNPEAREQAYGQLSRMIDEYRLDWIKLDFNLDPWQGCNRADHGHEPDDGLQVHYEGYYALLDRLLAAYPGVILENCSSGGQRVDLGLLSHLHCTFLSDNDETHNTLRFYEGIAPFLPPEAILRWSWSESRADEKGVGPFPSFHAWDTRYAPYELDFHMRAGMLGWLGFSHKLSEFGPEPRALFRRHIAFYKEVVRPYLREGVLSLPGWSGFAVTRPLYLFRFDREGGCLLFAFSLQEQQVTLRLEGLEPRAFYTIEDFDAGRAFTATGSDLFTGLNLGRLRANESRVVRVLPVKGER